jgi:S-(hydroxymethyl)glutathione dehydrogenase / alcohol dehydrogenase
VPIETAAAVLRTFAEPQAVERVELRDPGPGEVLVRVFAAGVCHSDVGQADGDWSFPLPAVLGHEGAGVVEALGPGVTGVDVGARVVLSSAPGCGRCDHCIVGRPIRCQRSLAAMTEGVLTTGATPFTGSDGSIAAYSLLSCFSEHVVVAAESAVPLPSGVPADVAALIGCAVITGVGAAVETIEIDAGSRGAVIGVGGVGANALQGARLRGAADILGVDASPERLEQAVRLGATRTLNVQDEDGLDALRRSAAENGVDWAIVTAGTADAVRLGIEITRPGGTTAVVGLMPENQPVPVDMLDVVTYEKRIVGSAYGSLDARLLIPRIVRLYREGRLALDELISARLPLERINDAFELSRRAEGMRPVLTLVDGGWS